MPEIVSYLTQIHEFKGEQALFIKAKADTLIPLVLKNVRMLVK